MARVRIPLDVVTSRFSPSNHYERLRLRTLPSYFAQSLSSYFTNLRTITAFFDVKRISKPLNIAEAQRRLNYNLGYFSSNYATIFAMSSIYALLNNWRLLFLILTVGGIYGIGKLQGKGLRVGSWCVTSSQLYTTLAIIAVHIFFFAPPWSISLWLAGASAAIIFGHAIFTDLPIDEAFFQGGGIAGRPRSSINKPNMPAFFRGGGLLGVAGRPRPSMNKPNMPAFFRGGGLAGRPRSPYASVPPWGRRPGRRRRLEQSSFRPPLWGNHRNDQYRLQDSNSNKDSGGPGVVEEYSGSSRTGYKGFFSSRLYSNDDRDSSTALGRDSNVVQCELVDESSSRGSESDSDVERERRIAVRRQSSETVLQHALSKIQRAKQRDKATVTLTLEELNALEERNSATDDPPARRRAGAERTHSDSLHRSQSPGAWSPEELPLPASWNSVLSESPHSCKHCWKFVLEPSRVEESAPSHDLRWESITEVYDAVVDGCDFFAYHFIGKKKPNVVSNETAKQFQRTWGKWELRLVSRSHSRSVWDITRLTVAWEPRIRTIDTTKLKRESGWGVYALAGDPAADFVQDRPINKVLGSEPSLAFARECLETCLSSHGKTCQQLVPAHMPFRLVDVGSNTNELPRLIHGEKPVSYCALSYCWGGDQEYKTTKQNLSQYLEGICLPLHAKTIQDAIQVTRALHVRYLWIDALCIVQDDEDDITAEISRMPQIYKGACVTILAASSSSSQEGFLHPRRNRDLVFRLPYRRPDGLLGSVVLLNEGNEIDESFPEPIKDRAWTLQESLLSARQLHFGTTHLTWRCHKSKRLDGSEKELTRSRKRHEAQLEPWPPARDMKYAKILELWHEVVYDYSGRRMSVASDKLVALSGIAEDFAHVMAANSGASTVRYLAGLWSEDISRQLLWTRASLSDQSEVPPRPRPAYRAPSWSWASIDSQVELEYNRDPVFAGILGYQVTLRTEALPYGDAAAGVLALVGRVKKSPISWKLQKPERYADTEEDIGPVADNSVWYLEITRSLTQSRSWICGLMLLPTQELSSESFEGLLPIATDEDLEEMDDGLDETDEEIDESLDETGEEIDEDLEGTDEEIDEDLKGTDEEVDEDLEGTDKEIDEDLDEIGEEIDEDLEGIDEEIDEDLEETDEEIDEDLEGKDEEIDEDLEGKDGKVDDDLDETDEEIDDDLEGTDEDTDEDLDETDEEIDDDLDSNSSTYQQPMDKHERQQALDRLRRQKKDKHERRQALNRLRRLLARPVQSESNSDAGRYPSDENYKEYCFRRVGYFKVWDADNFFHDAQYKPILLI